MKALFLSIAIVAALFQIGGKPSAVEHEGAYTRYALTDSTTLEVYDGDSIRVVMTVCAPQCSSCARVYNKEGVLLQQLTPPLSSIFPLATIDKKTGQIVWIDNDNWEY